MSHTEKPRIFIASTVEQLEVARAVSTVLEYDAHCNIWPHGFVPGRFTLESIEDEIHKSDFAIFVLVPDDRTVSRKKQMPSPRDNVVLELGASVGALGRRRTFVLMERGIKTKLPSDLLGFTPLTFERRDPLASALEPACNAIRQQLGRQGKLLRIRDAANLIAYNERAVMSTGFARQALRLL